MNRLKSLCLILMAAIFSLPLCSQGLVVCKKDGTRVVYPYETIDSVLTYNYDEEPPVVGGGIDGENKVFTANGVSFTMVYVDSGTFQMGSTTGDSDEQPVHSVTISKGYYIGETEVTQALWKAVTGYSPVKSGNQWSTTMGLGDNYPAYFISYEDVQSFITKLNSLTGAQFRMPTEAEWEFAARGGNKSKGYEYSGSNTVGDVAWYYDNSGGKTHAVKTKAANELGIYDMSGNVREWCSDWYGSYSSSSVTDPTGPASGSDRVIRGGSWFWNASRCRSADRGYYEPTGCDIDLGVRLACSAVLP